MNIPTVKRNKIDVPVILLDLPSNPLSNIFIKHLKKITSVTGFSLSINIASPICPYVPGTVTIHFPRPSSPIKIPDLGMTVCVVKVSARDVDHKK